MNGGGLPPVLGVQAIMDRYGLRDRRAARRVMDDAGAFFVAGRLVVRVDDLDAHERAQRDARGAASTPPGGQERRSAARGKGSAPRRRREPLPAGWWQEGAP